MAKRRRDEFVLGWAETDTLVSGDDGCSILPVRAARAIEKRGFYASPPPAIFRLVPVTVAEVERQAARERKARKAKR